MHVLEATLPANPNCVLFTTDARALFGQRTHGQLMRQFMTLAAPFHGQSRLSVLVGLGCRFARDRRNQESLQATLFFVFDGPATADDLARLERSVLEGAQTFTASSIERLPDDAVWAGLWHRGQPHVIVEPDPGSANGYGGYERWFARAFEWRADQGPSVEMVAIDAGSPDLPPWTRVTPVATAYTQEEEAVERMRLCFALHYTLRILDAVGGGTEVHRQYLEDLFPADLVQRLGLDDLAERQRVLEVARRRLPEVLGHHDKLAMVGLLFSVSFTDGPLHASQMRVLRDAAHALGVTNEQVVAYLQRLW